MLWLLHGTPHVAREELYKKHKRHYPTLREYLKAAGLSESTVSDLAAVGSILVPFADEHGIKIDQYLGARLWGKFREAIPALRKKAKAGGVQGFKAILRDVKQLTTRDAVRAKYRASRSRMGYGTTIQCPKGEMILVAVMDQGINPDDLATRLGNVIEINGEPSGSALTSVLLAALGATLLSEADAQ